MSQVTCAFTYKDWTYEKRVADEQVSYQRRKQGDNVWEAVAEHKFTKRSTLSSEQIRRWNRGDYS